VIPPGRFDILHASSGPPSGAPVCGDQVEFTADSIVDRVYDQIKAMAVSYQFKPGERLNEGALSRRLGVSRTPLREALNRLNTEGLLNALPGKGFFCRDLDVQEIFSLYEMRKVMETGAVHLAVARASEADIDALCAFLEQTTPGSGSLSTPELAELDEAFHLRLLAMSGNAEMQQVLRNINARIRFVRWIDIDLGDKRHGVPTDHHAIAAALKARDAGQCAALLEKHINRRQEQISAFIKEAYAKIYMSGAKPDAAG